VKRREQLALMLSGDLSAVLEHVMRAERALNRYLADYEPPIDDDLEEIERELERARRILRGTDE